MTANSQPYAILILTVILTATLTAIITKAVVSPKPITTEVVKTEIVTVRDTIRQFVYRDRIKAVIDTVKIDAGEAITYRASLDTTIIADHYRIRTQVDYFHPDQIFSLRQNVTVAVDTVYVNRDRIVTNTVKRTNWNATAIGVALGIAGGFTISELLSR